MTTHTSSNPSTQPHPSSIPSHTHHIPKPLSPSLEHLESLKGERVSVILQGNIEIEGILRGYDSFLNLLLDDVIETTHGPTPKTTKVDKIFLVSMRIVMITKGSTIPYTAVQ